MRRLPGRFAFGALTFSLGVTIASLLLSVISPDVKVTNGDAPIAVTTKLDHSSSRLTAAGRNQSPKTEHGFELPFATEDLRQKYPQLPAIDPISMSGHRWLIPVGDKLYLLNRDNRIDWELSVEPDFILDLAVDTKGVIHVAVFDGRLLGVNDAGEELWSSFMSGSANYTQLKPYRDGVLAVLSMEAYRETKGFNCEDSLVFWRNGKKVWLKDFPREAKLEVFGDRIVALRATDGGEEVTIIP